MKKKEKKNGEKEGSGLDKPAGVWYINQRHPHGASRRGIPEKNKKKTLESIDNNAVDVIESVHLRNGGERR